MKFNFCPSCANPIEDVKVRPLVCGKCNWHYYDNPIPAVAALASNQDDPKRRIVMVRRGINPFKGEWCLPCGYLNNHEIPKVGACREMLEETGIKIRLEKLLSACAPMPGELNQIILVYLARIVSGTLQAGDDAQEVRYFEKDDCPKSCFRSHNMLIGKWWSGRLGEITGIDLD